MNQFRVIVLLEVLAQTVFMINAVPIRACGNDLVDTLMVVCGERGIYSPPEGYSKRTPATQSGIATRCCEKYCDTAYLETYCNKPATAQSQTAAAPPAPRNPPSWDDDREINGLAGHRPVHAGDLAPQTLLEERAGPAGHGGGAAVNGTGTPAEEKAAAGDDINPSERGAAAPAGWDEAQEGTTPRDDPTDRPHKSLAKERCKNRTRGEKKRRRLGRRRGSSERRTLCGEKKKDDAARRRKKEQRLLRNQMQSSSSKRRNRAEKKGSEVTTPVALETAEHPFKNAGYNGTSGQLSLANVTDQKSPPSPDTKKDGFFTTITAVLRDVIGYQTIDDRNR